jgi:hypothetical protein
MVLRYYLCRDGRIVFGDDIVATDLTEAVKTVTALRDPWHEATDAFEIWCGAEMLYCSTSSCAPAPVPSACRRSSDIAA